MTHHGTVWLDGGDSLGDAKVTRYTSALTLQVLGNAKGVFTTVLSIAIFQNPYTAASATGYAAQSTRCCVLDM
jgi:hypothetical protein